MVLGDVAAAAPHLIHLAVAGRRAINPRADTGAIRFHSDGLHLQPIRLGGLIAAEKLRHVVNAVDQHIDVAIVVEIAEGAAAAGYFFENPRSAIHRYICELAISQISIQDLALTISRLGIGLAYFWKNMTVAEEKVGPAVVVEIHEADAPAEKARILAEAGLACLIVENHLADIAIQAGGIYRETGFPQVEIAVAIIIDVRDAHSRLRLAVRTVGDSRFHGDIDKRAVLVVFVKRG